MELLIVVGSIVVTVGGTGYALWCAMQ